MWCHASNQALLGARRQVVTLQSIILHARVGQPIDLSCVGPEEGNDGMTGVVYRPTA